MNYHVASVPTGKDGQYRRIDVRPLTGAMGAEIHGVDLSRPLDAETFAEIRRAFLEYLAIFVRDQKLTPAAFAAFASRFGPLDPHHLLRGMAEQPEVLEIVREQTDPHVFAEGWHADVTWQERPALGTMLYGLEIPDFGGDTLFANQYLAYDSLSLGMKRMLEGVSAVHSAALAYGTEELAERTSKPDKLMMDRKKAAEGKSAHPVIRTHPETHRKALFVNKGWTSHLHDMSSEESTPVLQFLYNHSIRPEFTCRFRWAQGSLAFWDNRCTLHTPIDDYFGKRRHLWRVTVAGDRPC